MNLTPASSSDLPSAPILTRVSLSATRLMQTAIFMKCRISVEGADPRDLLTQDQRVNVVGPFVGVHRLEVREVAHRLVFGQDAVGAEQAPGLAGDLGRHVH